MSLPILQPSSQDTTQIRGNVTVDRSVIIASGVILNATEGHKIVLKAGVCVGMGTIINAYGGDIEVRENAILGSGSLIFGSCIIGSQVSLGASVTVYNANVEPRTVIPAGTIIGDRSRKISIDDHTRAEPEIKEYNTEKSIDSNTQSILDGIKNGFNTTLEEKQGTSPEVEEKPEEELINDDREDIFTPETEVESKEQEKVIQSNTEVVNQDPWQEDTPTPSQVNNNVVGKVYINKLLFTLFPDKQR